MNEIIQSMSRVYRDLPDETKTRAEIRALMRQDPAVLGRFLMSGLEELLEDEPRACVLADQVLDRLAVRLATDTWTGPDRVRNQLQQLIHRSPRRSQATEAMSEWRRDRVLSVTVLGDNGFEGTCDMAVDSDQGQIHHIMPGLYEIALHGRVLWQGQLDEAHLLLTTSEQAPLRLAAATEPANGGGALRLNLLRGALQMEVYPGIEDGTIQFTRKAKA